MSCFEIVTNMLGFLWIIFSCQFCLRGLRECPLCVCRFCRHFCMSLRMPALYSQKTSFLLLVKKEEKKTSFSHQTVCS
uniref:Secreted protein n=1 Tax=Rhizophora mucronata TaxID=61149 RepID=A0A2P2QMK5_RHIMU